MKRRILTAALLLSVLLTGCGKNTDKNAMETTTTGVENAESAEEMTNIYENLDLFEEAKVLGYTVSELKTGTYSSPYYYVRFIYDGCTFLVTEGESSGDILFYGEEIDEKAISMGNFVFFTFNFTDKGDATRDGDGHWIFSAEEKKQMLELLKGFKENGPTYFIQCLTVVNEDSLNPDLADLSRELNLDIAYQKISGNYRFMLTDGKKLAWFGAIYSEADFRPNDNASGLNTYADGKYSTSGVLGTSFPIDYVNGDGILVSEKERIEQLRNFFADGR